MADFSFNSGASYAHYDIPKRRVPDMFGRAELVSSREILAVVKGERNG